MSKVYVVGYKVYGESGCDVDSIFKDKTQAENHAKEKNGDRIDTSTIGYVVKEMEVIE